MSDAKSKYHLERFVPESWNRLVNFSFGMHSANPFTVSSDPSGCIDGIHRNCFPSRSTVEFILYAMTAVSGPNCLTSGFSSNFISLIRSC